MKLTLFCGLIVCSLGLSNIYSQTTHQADGKKATEADQKEVAVLKTSEGEMIIEFWPEAAPQTVANFKKLAREGFYDGTAFHRIIRGFIIQCGDPITRAD